MLISAIKTSVSLLFNGFLMHRNKNKKYFINKCFMRKSSFLFCIFSRTSWKLEIKFYDLVAWSVIKDYPKPEKSYLYHETIKEIK